MLHDYLHMDERTHPLTLNQQGDVNLRKDSWDVYKGRVVDIYMCVFHLEINYFFFKT